MGFSLGKKIRKNVQLLTSFIVLIAEIVRLKII